MSSIINILRIGSCPTDKHPGQGIALHKLAQNPAFHTDYVYYDTPGETRFDMPNPNCTMIGIPFPNPTMPQNRRGLRFWKLQVQRVWAICAFFRSVCRAVKGRSYDIMHLHTPLHFLMLGWARRRRIPTVLTFHGTDFLRVRQSKLLQFILRNVDVMMCMTHDQVETAQRLFPQAHVQYIGNGVDLAVFKADDETPRNTTVVAVGNLRWQKDFSILIQAFATLKDRFPDWSVKILGEGPDRSALEELIEDQGLTGRVILAGIVSRDDVSDALKTSSVFTLSSQTEGLPKALLEAMAAGCACVSTDVGDCGYVLNGYGPVVPAKSVTALAAALETLIGDPEERRTVSASCVARAQDFSWDQYQHTHLNIYLRLCANPNLI